MAKKANTLDTKHPRVAAPEPRDHPKEKNSTDIDDAQLDDVTDDSAFKDDDRESEITDENQRSESRVEPRRNLAGKQG